MPRQTTRLLLALNLLAVILAGCSPNASPAPSIDTNPAMTQAFATAISSFTQTAQASAPTETPVPSPTTIRTPPTLPPIYQAAALNPLDTPHTYISDTCQYLKAKWDPNNSAPGTVVMIIMFHSISKGKATDANQISAADQRKLMNNLHDMGFQAINIQQLADFMERNTKIPPRSVLLVVDDRKFAEYFNDHFRPFYEPWGWPVVNGYIAKDERPDLWAENAALESEGWVDHQAHGVIHNVNIDPGSTDEFILGELHGAMTNIRKYLNKTPIAFVWPGGGFTPHAVELARQTGYRLGFTINPRGPVMYNWVPLGDQPDPQRPYYIPEGPANDPLLVLPRYWDTDARSHLDEVRVMGEQAAAYADQNKAVELAYYNIICAQTYGAIPIAAP